MTPFKEFNAKLPIHFNTKINLIIKYDEMDFNN